jgi:hypothetical protein
MNLLNHLMSRQKTEDQMLMDMARENRKVAHGAFYQGIREITGKDQDVEYMRQHCGIVTKDHFRFVEYTHKGAVILRVHAPEIIRDNTRRLVRINQQIEQVWKRHGRNRRK